MGGMINNMYVLLTEMNVEVPMRVPVDLWVCDPQVSLTCR